MKKVSVVIPLFNEEEVFISLIEELKELRSLIHGLNLDVEFVLVDDGSIDDTWNLIVSNSSMLKQFKCVRLSRNFGHQNALLCGYQHCTGDFVVAMDGDLQDPIEIVVEMIQKAMSGFDIVYGIRHNRYGESLFKKVSAKLFYRLLRLVSNVKTPIDCGDFRLLNRRALDVLLSMPEKRKYLRGMVGWVGFSVAEVEYDRPPRSAGKTKFSLRKMLGFATDGLLSFSEFPLRLSFYLALIVSFPFLCFLLYSMFLAFTTDATLERGWASLLLCIVSFGFIILLMLGVIGEYLARIFENVKGRPDYVVSDIKDFSDE